MKSKTIVVIPAFNEEKTILNVVKKAKKYSKEVIVIDDKSTDQTVNKIDKLCTVLKNSKNQGKGYTLRKGLDYAKKKRYPFIVMLDGDGEDNPDEIPKLIKELKQYDLIIADRDRRRSTSRRFFNNVTKDWLKFATGYPLTDPCSGFNAFNLNALKKINLTSDKFQCETEIVLEAKRNNLTLNQVKVHMPIFSDSKLQTIHSIQINNFFDKWILKHIYGLKLNPFKKILLWIFALVGLILGSIAYLFIKLKNN
jgi:glycosyltransferase involved in cell wall biosynthesis